MSTNHVQGHIVVNRPDKLLAPVLWSSMGKYRTEKGVTEAWGQREYFWLCASLHRVRESFLSIYIKGKFKNICYNQGVKSQLSISSTRWNLNPKGKRNRMK